MCLNNPLSSSKSRQYYLWLRSLPENVIHKPKCDPWIVTLATYQVSSQSTELQQLWVRGLVNWLEEGKNSGSMWHQPVLGGGWKCRGALKSPQRGSRRGSKCEGQSLGLRAAGDPGYHVTRSSREPLRLSQSAFCGRPLSALEIFTWIEKMVVPKEHVTS